MLEICKKEKWAKETTLPISENINDEVSLVGWKQKTSSKKNMSMSIYDVLSAKKFRENKLDKLTEGYSGAIIAALVNGAAMSAIKEYIAINRSGKTKSLPKGVQSQDGFRQIRT